ncbi:MAG: serine/threonine protein kinase [Clostridiales Family XIII bacterium]|nr:serine/threonine protein kinase [Clostridiales Family XIII bacterium]
MTAIGRVLENKYEIQKEIGRGGMSRVYLATDKRLNKLWAIKEIRKNGVDPRTNEVVVNSAIVEANLIKSLEHYHIPHINDIIDHESSIYIVMDFIEGESLESIIKSEGAQPERQVIKWGKQLCDALHYLHTRAPAIIYRDMKPANVMIKPDGDVKLIDFGIAREYKENRSADTRILGTEGYAPMEQFKGQTDARSDVYSLGATLYHAVTGYGPYDGADFLNVPIRNMRANLSGGFEKIIAKCTQTNPVERYQSCTELMYDLEHYQEVDDAFLTAQKTKIKVFGVFAVLAAVFLILGGVGMGMRAHTDNTDYSRYLAMAENAPDDTETVENYRKMIEVKPTEEAPYLGLIDVFKADAVFSTEEESQLLDVLLTHLPLLREQGHYPDLAYELGRLYWYYYAYGGSGDQVDDSNQATRMKSSVRWFRDVMDYGGPDGEHFEVAKIYHDIGLFNDNINFNVMEASDTGKYLPYWDNLEELLDIISANPDESEIISLTVDSITLDAIGTYARKFKADGVSEDELRRVYNEALSDARAVDATTDKTEDMKALVLGDRAQIAAQAIENAYREDIRELEY